MIFIRKNVLKYICFEPKMSLLIFVGFFYFINSSLCISLENPHSDKFYYEKERKKKKI